MTLKIPRNETGPTDRTPASSAVATPPGGVPAVNGPLRRTVRVVNPLGLHMRAADRFSRAARLHACEVWVWHGDVRADGKDLWALIGLVVMPDSEVILEVDGPDAAATIEPLCEILAAPGGEDYTN
ncbi:MAG: HPr family phosphocarrier protein [Planctomycetes bacterium]|nr:HPr family phosphocarrier protein [Planctomycetota bacterium]